MIDRLRAMPTARVTQAKALDIIASHATFSKHVGTLLVCANAIATAADIQDASASPLPIEDKAKPALTALVNNKDSRVRTAAVHAVVTVSQNGGGDTAVEIANEVCPSDMLPTRPASTDPHVAISRHACSYRRRRFRRRCAPSSRRSKTSSGWPARSTMTTTRPRRPESVRAHATYL